MSNERILIVDDDKEIRDLIEAYMLNEQYNVLKADNGQTALDIIDKEKIDLVILDIMMPLISGIDVCRQIRAKKNLPVILLTAKSTDIDKILGLNTGADDYMVKPFNPLELVARVRAQLRRYLYLNENVQIKKEKAVISINGLEINVETHIVTLYGNTINLTKTEYDIVLLMAQHPNRVFSLEEIFEIVWKEKYFDGNNTVMVHIARIRYKLGDNSKEPSIIKTIWGVGYKIES